MTLSGITPSIPSDGETKDLTELARAFADAESRLKLTEAHTNRVVSAVVNELRYAACHLLRAECPEIGQLDESNELQHHDPPKDRQSNFDRELRRAIDHCKRAKYDAIEYDTVVCQEQLNLFKRDYRLVIADDIEGMATALKTANAAQRLLASGEANPVRREQYLDSLDEVCNQLLESIDGLEALRPILNAKLERKQNARRWAMFTIAIAILAALAGSAAAVAKWIPLLSTSNCESTQPKN
jgi:hypothetical protein